MSDLDKWESAYLAFETPAEEVRKFHGRALRAGANTWDKTLTVLELFCGRGSGLRAWEQLGFRIVIGIDLSRTLLDSHHGADCRLQADARAIPLESSSIDVICVQGGFHHLASLDDMKVVLSEIHRVLRPGGTLFAVEPWLTPFLSVVHAVCRQRWLWPLSVKLRALSTMIALEGELYSRWLEAPNPILRLLQERFSPVIEDRSWGKLFFVGHRR